MQVTNQTITQVYLVPEIVNKTLLYDRLRWYRSSTGRNGFFEPVTALEAAPAVLRSMLVSRVLQHKILRLRMNGTVLYEVEFTGPPGHMTTDEVALQLNAAVPELVAWSSGSTLELRTRVAGPGASIEILESEAAPYLGFLVGESAVGAAPDNVLTFDVSEYRLVDAQSSPAMWYQVEFLNSVTGQASARSYAFASRPFETVPLSKLIGCYIRLADLAGRPLGGRRVSIHNVYMPNKVVAEGKTWGIFRQYEEIVTDPNGYAEAFLIRGAVIDFTIQGTGFTRRVTLPEFGTIVDLLDPALDADDEFGIHVNDYDFAIRTTT